MKNKHIALHNTPVGQALTSSINVFLRAAAFIFTLTPVVYFWLVVLLVSNATSVSGILEKPEPLLILAMGMLMLVLGSGFWAPAVYCLLHCGD